MRWALLAVAALAVVAFLGVGSYIGGEMRYRNCLQRVELEYPEAFVTPGGERGQYGTPSLSGEGSFEFFRQSDREGAISSCSRWP